MLIEMCALKTVWSSSRGEGVGRRAPIPGCPFEGPWVTDGGPNLGVCSLFSTNGC